MGIVVDKIPVYKRIGGVFVKVEERSEENLEYLMEPDVEEIEAVYIEEVEGFYEEEKLIHEYKAEP